MYRPLENVDFTLRKGEIHALIGENGAGKSTLIKVLTGVDQPDSGTIHINQQYHIDQIPQHAQSLGISTVYQEVNLCPQLTIAENILIGREPMKWWEHRLERQMNARAKQILQGLDINIDVTLTLRIVFGGNSANGSDCACNRNLIGQRS